MRHNGNLVLASHSGRILWTSRTRGSGKQNRLVVRNSGNLVMYTASGKIVWESHTTRVLLGGGDQLRSGQRMVFSFDYRDSLRMRADGELVYRCGPALVWKAPRKRPGPYLVMQTNGNLVLRGPHGRMLWSAQTAKAGWETWLDVRWLSVFTASRIGVPIWQPKQALSAHC